jgi:tetratricopeptide (TPR) repeat protein
MEERQSFRGSLIIAILAGLLGLFLLGYFIYRSGQSEALTQLEVTLFSILTLILELGAGFFLGDLTTRDRAREEYQPFVRSALRRTYGLAEGIGRAQDSVRESVRRMATRKGLDPTASNQLWGEIMNLIYLQLNEVLRQTEASIEDWREMGPEEIQRLQESQQAKQRRIQEITERLQELYDLISDLEALPTRSSRSIDRMEIIASTLEHELATIRDRSVLAPIDVSSPETGEARKLLLIGAYEEAVNAYSQMIDLQPTCHSLYIGRAKAKYLAGDKDAALEDLDLAEQLQPADPVVKRARQQIMEGRVFPTGASAEVSSQNIATAHEGNAALMEGKAEEARQLFAEAEKLGLNPAFARMNQAMVEILDGQPEDALEVLNPSWLFPPISGEYMTVQTAMLRAISEAQMGNGLHLDDLEQALENCPDFQLSKSPLRFLRTGLILRQMHDNDVETVFNFVETFRENEPD